MITELDEKKVEVSFTVVKEKEKSKTINPPTGDNVYEYVVKLGICLIGFIYSIFSIKKIVKNS